MVVKKAPKRLCIVSPYSYPLFNPEQCRTHFGGWEVRTALIAKELARRGNFEVSVVVWDHGQPHIEQRDGVTLYSWSGKPDPSGDFPESSGTRSPAGSAAGAAAGSFALTPSTGCEVGSRRSARIKAWLRRRCSPRSYLLLSIACQGFRSAALALYGGLRSSASSLCRGLREALRALGTCLDALWHVAVDLFGMIGHYPIPRSAVAIYDEVNADIYLVPGNHNRAAEVACFCKKRKKKYVFLAGSDMDYDPAYKTCPEKFDVYGVPGHVMVYAIEEASLHVVQSAFQSECLLKNYRRTSVVVPNPIDTTPSFPRSRNAAGILWVGSADDRVRRPSLVLELARRLHDFRFTIIMVPAVPETYQQCTAAARSLPNVALVGRTAYSEIERYYAEAGLLVNTSAFEGFPNSFLQAAKYGVPIVALKVNPGEMLTRHGCGYTCDDDLEQLARQIRTLMSDSELYGRISTNCVRYVEDYHDKTKIIPQLEAHLLRV